MEPSAPPPTPMGEFSRISGVFFEPGKTFADIAAHPRFWVPLILVALMAGVFMFSFNRRVGFERVMMQQMETNPRMQQLSAEQRAQAVETQRKIAPIMGTAMSFGAPVIAGASMVLVAAVLLLFMKMMGADLRFKQVLGITAYAHLPTVLNSAVATAVVYLKNPDEFNLENPTAFNLAAFLDPNTKKSVMALANSVDLFVIWVVILLAIGFSAAQPKKLTFGKALAGVLIPWAIWIAGKTAIAALRG